MNFFKANEDRFLNEIIEVLRIPSVSTDSAYAADVARMAAWIVERLKQIGVPAVELVETARHPIVEGRWTVDANKKTLLVYGHYDVQPVDPIELWESGPFDAEIRDGKIFARGSADLKITLLPSCRGSKSIIAARGSRRFT